MSGGEAARQDVEAVLRAQGGRRTEPEDHEGEKRQEG